MEMYDDVGECWKDLADALSAGADRILLYGPPGTGKTYAALHMGVRHGYAERLVCTEDLTSAEITGSWMPVGSGRWEWLEGPAIRAWRGVTGHRLVVDEVDRASGDALSTLLLVTDSSDSARWRSPETGEWVAPAPDFSVVMTTNAEEMTYVPEALRDRFPVAIRIDRPHPAALMRLSEDLRAPALYGSVGDGRRLSLRSFYAFDQLRSTLGSERAAALLFGVRDGQSILDSLRIGHLG